MTFDLNLSSMMIAIDERKRFVFRPIEIIVFVRIDSFDIDEFLLANFSSVFLEFKNRNERDFSMSLSPSFDQ